MRGMDVGKFCRTTYTDTARLQTLGNKQWTNSRYRLNFDLSKGNRIYQQSWYLKISKIAKFDCEMLLNMKNIAL